MTGLAATRWLPFLAFFASGASSLILQASWTRVLHHVFGAQATNSPNCGCHPLIAA